MRGSRAAAFAVCAAVVFPLVGTACSAPAPAPEVHGLYPDRPEGMSWTSSWDEPRAFTDADPDDPWFVTDGSGTYEVTEGRLVIGGAAPRMYVRDPSLQRQWRDVEITTHFRRRADAGVPYAGMTAVARTNHGQTGRVEEDLCDSRGYGARMRYDGATDFEKETAHPHNEATANKTLWPDGMPVDVWFGFKFVVYDLPEGAVKLELYLNTSIADDGTEDPDGWELVNELVDDGNVFGDAPCAAGIDPRMPLTASPDRSGSESGSPNLSVYFRSDGVGEDGLVYQRVSVREIRPPDDGSR